MSEETISAIKSLFDSENLVNAIDIKSLIPLSLSVAKNDPTLAHFFALDENGPFSEILERGTQSLRKGFYKLISKPYYRTNIWPGTFAADVYYYNDQDDLFKYHANIGPLTNTSWQPRIINDRDVNGRSIIESFESNKRLYGPEKDYMIAKEKFYDAVFKEQPVIYVIDAIWDPSFPTINKRKQVTWGFIN